ncbi:MAG: multidrug efflux SMR transporter [Lachnospiraceae bacterium]|nr:multidrug efflux SMR transporter [Lachnospiraceae bacterium]
MHYFLLGLAILCEILATTMLKYSEGLTKLYPSIGCIGAYILCYFFFGKAITKIHLGIAYATWCGVGIVVTTLISYFVFKEKLNVQAVIGILCITVGCVILNLKTE